MIGWTLLSRQAVARAAEALAAGDRGVRDEVGFLSIHQVISDRLFPGTSVLHTRARYALLVPWLMQHVAASGADGDLERRLLQAEASLAGQLVRGQESGLDAAGAIGADVWRLRKQAPAQPASFSYWSALSAWGILVCSPNGTSPRRVDVLRQLSRKRSRGRIAEDDPDPAAGPASPFIALPPAPQELGRNSEALSLALTGEERRFLRLQLVGVRRADRKQSLLASLAEARTGGDAEAPWVSSVVALADRDDRAILAVARDAAAIAAIGRGIYAALVEEAWNADRNKGSGFQAEKLAAVRDEHAARARALDVDELTQTFPEIPSDLLEVLRRTQAWLQKDAVSPKELRECYAAAEWRRKFDRSKLTSKYSGRGRRDEWDPEKHPGPVPLGYRWGNVARLLRDISG